MVAPTPVLRPRGRHPRLRDAGFTLDRAVPASCSAAWCLLEPVFAVVDAFAPDFVADWVSNLRSYPLTLLGFVVAFVLLLLARGYLRRRTDDACNAAYYALGPLFQGRRPEAVDFRPGPWERRLLGLPRRLRESPLFSDQLPQLIARTGPWLVMLLVVAALWGIWWACSDTRVEVGPTPSVHLAVITKSRASPSAWSSTPANPALPLKPRSRRESGTASTWRSWSRGAMPPWRRRRVRGGGERALAAAPLA